MQMAGCLQTMHHSDLDLNHKSPIMDLAKVSETSNLTLLASYRQWKLLLLPTEMLSSMVVCQMGVGCVDTVTSTLSTLDFSSHA